MCQAQSYVGISLIYVPSLVIKAWAVRPGARYRLQSGPGIRVTIAQVDEKKAAGLAGDIANVLGMDARGP